MIFQESAQFLAFIRALQADSRKWNAAEEKRKGGCTEHYIFIFWPLSDSITAGEKEKEEGGTF